MLDFEFELPVTLGLEFGLGLGLGYSTGLGFGLRLGEYLSFWFFMYRNKQPLPKMLG